MTMPPLLLGFILFSERFATAPQTKKRTETLRILSTPIVWRSGEIPFELLPGKRVDEISLRRQNHCVCFAVLIQCQKEKKKVLKFMFPHPSLRQSIIPLLHTFFFQALLFFFSPLLLSPSASSGVTASQTIVRGVLPSLSLSIFLLYRNTEVGEAPTILPSFTTNATLRTTNFKGGLKFLYHNKEYWENYFWLRCRDY
ncbi:Hypothetical protein, putative [Bodo saltans]|uniref:Membrane-associated protein n=1 Tax=Bodo saltans TaxID=75058 RepID=A0A0S4II79_BODSA|nr:Hypothetical protein, putative [Bodo saltans]|eukprot:CUE71023.1 Hypothetical protein, putative [Bodo saltans]